MILYSAGAVIITHGNTVEAIVFLLILFGRHLPLKVTLFFSCHVTRPVWECYVFQTLLSPLFLTVRGA